MLSTEGTVMSDPKIQKEEVIALGAVYVDTLYRFLDQNGWKQVSANEWRKGTQRCLDAEEAFYAQCMQTSPMLH